MIKKTGLPDSVKSLFHPINLLYGAVAIAILVVLYFISLQSYLLFHGIVEIAGIAVAFSIFIIIWNTRQVIWDAFYLIIGIAFLVIGIIDLAHMLTFSGMVLFPKNSSDISLQLSIAARCFQSITFFIATLFIGKSITKSRRYDVPIIVTACTTVCVLLFFSLFVWRNFPTSIVEGLGLTPFRIISEYLIALILIATIVILYRKREHFDPAVLNFLITALVFLILSELTLTSSVSVYGFMNLLGYLFRLLSVYFFYRTFVVISLTRPHSLLLLKLRMEEHELRERFKELNCMYSISALMALPEVSLTEIMEKTVHLIPPAMQFHDIAEARIVLEGQNTQTAPFLDTTGILAQEIRVNGNPVGRVEVWYREERPGEYEGPFTIEERNLINVIAERMGILVERLRAEEAIRESRTLLAITQRLAKVGGWEWDVARQMMTWTDETYRIHGFNPADGSVDLVQRSIACYDPDDRVVVKAAFRACSEKGIPYDMEIPFTPASGSRIWVRTKAQPVSEGGRIVKVVGNLMDITERKLAVEAFRSANKKLNLLSGITRHDIRNQLTVLSGYLELSKRSLADPAAMANFIAREEKVASAIARQISFTKDYEDLGVKSAVWQDVSALVRSAVAALPVRNTEVDIRCSGFEVFADPLLEKVFYNLIDNSLHYGGEKMTAIRITAEKDGGDLRIICEDDGDGIGAEDKMQLFTKGFGKHTGLGLFLSREILSITGITITEIGVPGKGARFEIMVPNGAWRFIKKIIG